MIVFFVADEGTTEDISEFRIGIENTTSEKLIGLCNIDSIPTWKILEQSLHLLPSNCHDIISRTSAFNNRAKADPIGLPAYFVFKVRHMQWAIS